MDTVNITDTNQTSQNLTWNEEELKQFREIVQNDSQLKSRTDDLFLLSFLRARKYNKERALKLLRTYYSVRRSYVYFKNLTPSAMKEYLNMHITGILRYEPDLLIGLGRASHWDTTKANVIDVARCILLHLDLELNNHPIQVHGFHVLIDAKTITWKHFIQFTPKIIYHVVTCLYQSMPIRYNSIHVVNENKYINAVYALAYHFIPSKIRKRFHFHGSNFEALHKQFDPKYLPAEFGGELPPFDPMDEVQRLLDNEELFIKNEKYWTEVESS